MIQESKILQWFKKHERANSWFILLFTKPHLYLYNLSKKTIYMGLLMFFVVETEEYVGFTQAPVPGALHGLIGVVIGLLLVFRTNTAYDRWWEARKTFAAMQSSMMYFYVKAEYSNKRQEILHTMKKMNNIIFSFVSADCEEEKAVFKNNFIKKYKKLSELFYVTQLSAPVYGSVERKMAEFLDLFCALEKIGNTPIPLSYSFHIKLSVFIYLMTLPFGLFFGLGLWSVLLVMILFFIISGIEIISNEIENPFKGDPNDLPIDEYKKEVEKFLNN